MNFQELVGEDLSGVTFVRDYIQLQFNPPPLLNALTSVSVRSADRIYLSGDEGFANAIIAQINKIVAQVDFKDADSLNLLFEDGSSISISLRPEDYVGPEAVNLFLRDKSMVVI